MGVNIQHAKAKVIVKVMEPVNATNIIMDPTVTRIAIPQQHQRQRIM